MDTINLNPLTVEQLDPEWTHWVKCPATGCKAVTHACCAAHALDGMREHIAEKHQ